jgi:hypothetical protein
VEERPRGRLVRRGLQRGRHLGPPLLVQQMRPAEVLARTVRQSAAHARHRLTIE